MEWMPFLDLFKKENLSKERQFYKNAPGCSDLLRKEQANLAHAILTTVPLAEV